MCLLLDIYLERICVPFLGASMLIEGLFTLHPISKRDIFPFFGACYFLGS